MNLLASILGYGVGSLLSTYLGTLFKLGLVWDLVKERFRRLTCWKKAIPLLRGVERQAYVY